MLQWTDEKAQLSTSKNLNVTETIVATENENKVDVNVEESVAIAIQAAIRGILVFTLLELYDSENSGE